MEKSSNFIAQFLYEPWAIVSIHLISVRLSFVSFMISSSTVKDSTADSMHTCLTPDCTADLHAIVERA